MENKEKSTAATCKSSKEQRKECQADRQRNRQIYRQKERQIDRWADRQADRQTDGLPDRPTKQAACLSAGTSMVEHIFIIFCRFPRETKQSRPEARESRVLFSNSFPLFAIVVEVSQKCYKSARNCAKFSTGAELFFLAKLDYNLF